MAIPTNSWNEDSPAGQETKALGANRMRELKTQFREILGVDHIISSAGNGDTWGYHKKCTFYNRTSDSVPSTDNGCLFAKDSGSYSSLYWIDETTSNPAIQLTGALGFTGGMTGEVRAFSGLIADIPTGWALCDGVSSSLNLMGRFVRGIDTNTTTPGMSTAAGSDGISLGTMPAHTHTATSANKTTDHTHSMTYYLNEVSGAGTVMAPTKWTVVYNTRAYNQITDEGTSSHSDHSGTSGSSGSGTEFDNRPAYREYAFIIKT